MIEQGKKIGFSGTRNGMTDKQEFTIRMMLARMKPLESHHGDCQGSDKTFHGLCKKQGCKIIVHPPVSRFWRAFCRGDVTEKPKPYLDRNKDIVDAADVLIATPDGPETLRSGTWSTIRYAKKKKKPIYLVWPSGDMEVLNGKKSD